MFRQLAERLGCPVDASSDGILDCFRKVESVPCFSTVTGKQSAKFEPL